PRQSNASIPLPLKGNMSSLVAAIKFLIVVQCFYHIAYIIVGKLSVHWERKAMCCKVLSIWTIAFFISQVRVSLLQVTGHGIVQTRIDILLIEILHQSVTLRCGNNEEMKH